jgi:hypothetical protein
VLLAVDQLARRVKVTGVGRSLRNEMEHCASAHDNCYGVSAALDAETLPDLVLFLLLLALLFERLA